MIPKIIFRRSWLYDKFLKREKFFKFPSHKVLGNHLQKLEKNWDKVGDKILREISNVTKLKWSEKEIVCYLTYGVFPFSDPVTLNLKSDIHTLTHELIHRILSEPENWIKVENNWFSITRKYRKEKEKARYHIIIHAIHTYILKKLFNSKILEKEKKWTNHPDYIRSWEIVERDGYLNIIKELTEKKK